MTNSPVIILLIMNVILLIAGTFMDVTPAILIFTAVSAIVRTFGMHPRPDPGVQPVYRVHAPVNNTLFVAIRWENLSGQGDALYADVPRLHPGGPGVSDLHTGGQHGTTDHGRADQIIIHEMFARLL